MRLHEKQDWPVNRGLDTHKFNIDSNVPLLVAKQDLQAEYALH